MKTSNYSIQAPSAELRKWFHIILAWRAMSMIRLGGFRLIFDETHRLDRYCNATNVTPGLLIGRKCFINSWLFLPLCHWCKHYAKLLESERHLSNRDFGFWAVYFPAELDGAAAQKTEIYLVSETENIDQKHVLLREDKHASFIPHCQFPLRQKALESTTTGLGW